MLKFQERMLQSANFVLDSVIIAVSMILTFHLRVFIAPFIQNEYAPVFRDYLNALLVVIPLGNFFLYLNGLYPVNRLRPMRTVLGMIIKANVGVAIVCVIMLYAVKIYAPGRIVIVFFMVINSCLLFAKEAAVRAIFTRVREKGLVRNNLLIIGDKSIIPKITDVIKKDPYLGMKISAIFLLDESAEWGAKHFGEENVVVFDKKADIHLVLFENEIDNVLIAVGKEKLSETEELILKCEEYGTEIWLYADFFELLFAQKEIDSLGKIPILVFRTTPKPTWALLCKRMIDVAGSLVLMVLASPLMLVAVLGIKMTMPGPVIFRQKRVGLHGRKFVFFKFRSMVTDAEQRRQELCQRNIMKGPAFKVKCDPRVTPFGKFLRKTSIDELPQLWNILKGEMSLVGARPPLPTEVAEYRGWQRRRFSMRPGLTCLWQVSGRNKITDFDEWTKLDLEYIDNWSLWLDFVILLKTIPAVIFRIGAE